MRSLISLLAAAATLLALAAPASATILQCGQTLTKSVTMTNNPSNCPGKGLIIGADNIVVDLGGRTISGAPGNWGVDFAGHSGVTLRNGFVRDFHVGAYVDGNANTIDRLRATRGSTSGIQTFGVWIEGDRNRVLNSTQSGYDRGVNVGFYRSYNTITGDRASNTFVGVWLESEGIGNTVSYSTMTDNAGVMMILV
jgi:hypothetical protein